MAVLLEGMLTALCLALSAAENQQLGSRSHQLAMWTNSWAVDNTLRNASHQQVGGGGLCIVQLWDLLSAANTRNMPCLG